MPAAGYSGTPLVKKLGIGDTVKLRLLHPPPGYLDLLEKDISKQLAVKNGVPDLVHLFAKNRLVFEKEMIKLQFDLKLNRNLVIWVSWYKKSSGISTDLNEQVIRDYALANGLVDVKVCAVDEQWSALKLVVPLAKRK
jgi:hypothetical protein